jgi:predicted DNA-binding protein
MWFNMGKKAIAVYLEKDTIEKIGSLSKKAGISKAGYIRMILMKHLEEVDKK